MNGLNPAQTATHDDIDFVRTALTTHVRQVHNFCMASVSRLDDMHGSMRIHEEEKLRAVASRLLNHAEQMVLATRLMPKPHGINTEQLDAEIQQARQALTSLCQITAA